jgi:hypothetical protein
MVDRAAFSLPVHAMRRAFYHIATCLCLIAASLYVSACFHATIETGAAPASQVIEEHWAHGFLAGLIAPDVMASARQCPNGVSVVETEHSFLNILATVVTASLYTPMSIKVTCASGPVVAPPADSTRSQNGGRQGGQGGRRGGIGGRGGRPPAI